MPRATPPPGAALFGLRNYRKLVRPKLTALVLDDGYHVQGEARRALAALGHNAVRFDLRAGGEAEDARAQLARLLRTVAEVRPDFLFSVNYVGFDRAGWLGEIVESVGMPVALWFVDAPLFFAMGHLPPTPTMTSAFVWDRTHLERLRALGATRAHHLPLGCEPEAFAPPASAAGHDAADPCPRASFATAFVGSSMRPLSATWRARLTPAQVLEAEAMADALYAEPAALHRLVPAPQPPVDPRAVMAAYANCLASRRYRGTLLRGLPQARLHVFGDDGWRDELPRAHHHPAVGYGAAVAQVYRAARINLNATIRQMPSAVNQRVFDVPVAGGFLLTDDQPELHELFDVDAGEAVVYAGAEQLADQVARYAARPAERAAVAARGRARVLAEHTYLHRMRVLLAALRRDHHGARPCGTPLSAPRQTSGAGAHGANKAANPPAAGLSQVRQTR